jgi:hypothetical protein
MTREEMLIKTGLNWNVKSEGLITVSGIEVADRVALVREDTSKILGIHTPNYVPYQNDELLELLYRIGGQTGLEVHSGGCFKGGEKVWFQLKSDDLKLGNDTIKGYISGFNSFDGRTALAFGNSNVTVSCMNTFWRGYKQVDSRLRHSSTMKPRIEEILRRIDLLLKEEKDGFEEIKRMNQAVLSPEVKELVTRLDGVGMTGNKRNKLARFDYDLGIELAQKGDTIWGLFSGVTRYTTHSMRIGDNSEAKMFGKAGTTDRQIYNELVEMVS